MDQAIPETLEVALAQVALPAALVERAEHAGIDVARLCRQSLERALLGGAASPLSEDDERAIDAFNERIDRDGLPLAHYRMF